MNADIVDGLYLPNKKKILLTKIRLTQHNHRLKVLFDGIINGLIYVFDLLHEIEENGDEALYIVFPVFDSYDDNFIPFSKLAELE